MPLKKTLISLTLSKLNIELSKAETMLCLNTYFRVDYVDLINNVLFLYISGPTEKLIPCLNRLAFAKACFLLSKEKQWQKNLTKHIKEFKLKQNKKATFKVLPFNHTNKILFINKIANNIINSGLAQKICLTTPDLVFCGFEAQNLFGLRIWTNKDSFNLRKTHLKPAPHPSGIDPRIARAMINLASAKTEVLDPFCGAGGILEEAKLLDLNILGTDISWKMIKLARVNLKDEKGLFRMSALSWNKKVECVVTDLPYGKNSKLSKDLNLLITEFLEHYHHLTTRMVVCVPNTYDLATIAKNKGWSVLIFFDIYVHGTLTRRIHVLEHA